ncbi:MAG: EamA family transporter [Candidatus Korarchaeota archaeon]|nr:EamA family transporter [Candidatus Korarchaeota archaeon]
MGGLTLKGRGLLSGKVYVAVAALLWGTIGIATKMALAAGAGPAAIGAFRALISAGLALIVLRERVLDRKLMALGLLFTGPLFLTYMFSVTFSGMGIAAVLLYTAPAFVIIFAAIFLKEKITERKLAALALASAGAVLTQLHSLDQQNLAGIAFGLGSSLAYSGIILMARKLMTSGYTALEVGLGPQPWSALELLPFIFLDTYRLNFDFLVAVTYLGVFTSFLAYYLHAKGVGEIEASLAGIISNVEPASAVMFGLLLGEKLETEGVVGSLLVILGAMLAG